MRQDGIVQWVRRKHGSHITVWRQKADGTLGSAVPCVVCRREIERFGLRVHCTVAAAPPADPWFHGRLDDAAAPRSKPTSGQVRAWRSA